MNKDQKADYQPLQTSTSTECEGDEFNESLIDDHLRRQKLNSEELRAAYEDGFGKRLEARSRKIYQSANKMDHAELARRFTDLWVLEKLLQRANHTSHLGYLVANEMLDRDAIKRRSGIKAKLQGDPKHIAMNKIRAEFSAMLEGRTKHRSDAQFAREMAGKHPEIVNEGSIKNALSRWRRLSSN